MRLLFLLLLLLVGHLGAGSILEYTISTKTSAASTSGSASSFSLSLLGSLGNASTTLSGPFSAGGTKVFSRNFTDVGEFISITLSTTSTDAWKFENVSVTTGSQTVVFQYDDWLDFGATAVGPSSVTLHVYTLAMKVGTDADAESNANLGLTITESSGAMNLTFPGPFGKGKLCTHKQGFKNQGSLVSLKVAINSTNGVQFEYVSVQNSIYFERFNYNAWLDSGPNSISPSEMTFTPLTYLNITVSFSTDLFLLGNAGVASNRLTLTPALADKKGAAWLTQSIQLSGSSGPSSWSTSFSFLITPGSGVWASGDGFTFAISKTITISSDGGSTLGYGGIPNSVAIEFDTFKSSDFPDPNSNHIGINLNGNMTSVITYNPPTDLKGTTYHCWVDYQGGATKTLKIFLSTSSTKPSTSVLSYQVDLAATVGSTGYLGFTAATGGAYEDHQILSWKVQGSSTSPSCQNGGVPGTGSQPCNCAGTGFSGTYCQTNINDCPAVNSCQNGGQCVDKINSYICNCTGTGFSGSTCQTNINDCPAVNPCQNGGRCVDGINTYTCNCAGTGFSGSTCQTNINDCPTPNPCLNGGRCVDGINAYTCNCNGTGFSGSSCQTNINDCPAVNPCQNGGRCVDGINSYSCNCTGSGFTGSTCQTNIDDCPAVNPCQNGGQCIDGINTYTCNCTGTGFDGFSCENNINDCAAVNSCQNGGQCVDKINSYICDCANTGFSGSLCEININDCPAVDPCQHGGVCVDGVNTFSCNCAGTGFEGDSCEININDCPALNPCQNGGQCVDGINTYTCDCADTGFEGDSCQTNINDCPALNPCFNGGVCVDGISSFTCDCSQTGFFGPSCETNIDDCPALNPCQHGGQCVDDINSYTCHCGDSGYEGAFCEININDCPAVNPCQHGGRCVDGLNSFTCDCSGTGFSGSECQTNLDDCPAVNPCQNGGVCIDGVNSFTCDCNGTGFEGSLCQSNANDCPAVNPCQHGGVCVDGLNSFTCDCSGTGFSGTTCQTNINDCPAVNPCQNGGSCVDGINTFTCNCAGTGFSGSSCQTNINDCPAVNPCQYGGRCVDGINSFSCDCTGTGFIGSRCAYRLNCTATSQPVGNALWPTTPVYPGGYTWGTCQAGYVGSPYRICGNDGQFGSIVNPCVSSTVQCPSEGYANALWPATYVGNTATGVCITEYAGSPQRQCKVDGTWSTLVNNHCLKVVCSARLEDYANWPMTPMNTTAVGNCTAGFTGTPTRLCSASLQWQPISNPCTATSSCATQTYARAVWPNTSPGATATGTCISGWTGAPLRICKADGTWQDLVSNHCIRI